MTSDESARDGASIDPWLDKVYHAGDSAEVTAHYDAWGAAYERDLMAAGYRYPPVAGAYFGRFVAEDALILDAGCGTGLMGEALSAAGYTRLVGLDPSEGMREVANAKGCYERVLDGLLDAEIAGVADGEFDAAVALGVLTPGHAPAAALEGLVRAVRPQGVLIFSVTTPAWEEGGFGAMAEALATRGAWTPLAASPVLRPMPYSAGEGELTARVYAYRKL